MSWVCGGYAWSTKRAWSTSAIPGTSGCQARRAFALEGMARTYKTLTVRRPEHKVVSPLQTKIAVVLRGDLSTWQRLNATAFLISGVAGGRPELLGEPYEDADGTSTYRCSASP